MPNWDATMANWDGGNLINDGRYGKNGWIWANKKIDTLFNDSRSKHYDPHHPLKDDPMDGTYDVSQHHHHQQTPKEEMDAAGVGAREKDQSDQLKLGQLTSWILNLESKQDLNIFFMCDTTSSMGNYVQSLAATIIQLLEMLRLIMPNRAHIAIISYKDYYDSDICTWVPLNSTPEEIITFVKALEARGGGDTPEATKTGLNKIAEMIREDESKSNDSDKAKNVVVHYTDAPPHFNTNCNKFFESSEQEREEKAMTPRIPGYDWVDICRWYSERDIPIYTFFTVEQNHQWNQSGFMDITMSLLLHLGPVVVMRDTSVQNVTKATIGMFMHIFGQKFDHDGDFSMLGCDIQSDMFERQGWVREAGYQKVDWFSENTSSTVSTNYVTHLDLTLNKIIKNETAAGGFRPEKVKHPYLSTKVPFTFRPINIRIDVKEIIEQFSTDSEFKDTVFKVFNKLFTVESCDSMTYNPILGKLWRALCKMRDDVRVEKLKTKLSTVVSEMKDGDIKKTNMKNWLDTSYNAKQEIGDILLDKKNYKDEEINNIPCLILDPAKTFSNPDQLAVQLRTLARAPSRKGLAVIQTILTSLVFVGNPFSKLPVCPPNKNDDSEIPLFLPMALHSEVFFSCLAHLASPGMLFTLRPALFIAIVAFLSNNKYLVDKATDFLETQKGKWIDLKNMRPELLSVETVKLLLSVPQFLTDEENEVFKKLNMVHRLRLALNSKFEMVFPLSPSLNDEYSDWRFQCHSCKQYRSSTIMTKDGTHHQCGLCHFYYNDPKESDDPTFCKDSKNAFKHYSPINDPIQSDVKKPEEKSRLISCSVPTCGNLYEIVSHEDLKVKPKCHFCRNQKPSPFVSCDICFNRYVLQDETLLEPMRQMRQNALNEQNGQNRQNGQMDQNGQNEQMDQNGQNGQNGQMNQNGQNGQNGQIDQNGMEWNAPFVCAICTKSPDLSRENKHFLFQDILKNNRHLLSIFNLVDECFKIIKDKKITLFKLFEDKKLWAVIEKTPSPNNKLAPIMLKNRECFKSEALKATIKNEVENGDLTEICSLCCEDVLVANLENACSNSTCGNRLCFPCQKHWVSQIQPGKVILPSHLVCPFCKSTQKEDFYTRFHPHIKELFRKDHIKAIILRMDIINYYYGWCIGCYKIKEICDVVCGDTTEVPYSMIPYDFLCENCKNGEEEEDEGVDPDLRYCPGCDHPTEKSSGCNHMNCPICDTHWCYVCNEACEKRLIYTHLREKHGSIGL